MKVNFNAVSEDNLNDYFDDHIDALSVKFGDKHWDAGALRKDWKSWRGEVCPILRTHTTPYLAEENATRKAKAASQTSLARLKDPDAPEVKPDLLTDAPMHVCATIFLRNDIKSRSEVIGLLCYLALAAAASAVECERYAQLMQAQWADTDPRIATSLRYTSFPRKYLSSTTCWVTCASRNRGRRSGIPACNCLSQ
jgi:hypothetical protein